MKLFDDTKGDYTMKQYESYGSISSGTMRPQDVLPAIMDVLFEYHPEVYQRITSDIASEFDVAYSELDEDHEAWRSEFISYIINEDAWDAMQEIAPPGAYFGAHPGDGSDYGFWIDEDSDVGKLITIVREFLAHTRTVGFKDLKRAVEVF